MVAQAPPGDAPITLGVYPGAHRGFNFVLLQPGRSSPGHWLEYNEPAAGDAEVKVRAFLAMHLAAGESATAK
jgi:hypothetical protein